MSCTQAFYGRILGSPAWSINHCVHVLACHFDSVCQTKLVRSVSAYHITTLLQRLKQYLHSECSMNPCCWRVPPSYIMRITYKAHITNNKVTHRSGQLPATLRVMTRRLHFFCHTARADPSQDHSYAHSSLQPSPTELATPARSTKMNLALNDSAQPLATQCRPQLSTEASTGPFQVASTRGDGYVLPRTCHPTMMMMMMMMLQLWQPVKVLQHWKYIYIYWPVV